MFRYFVLKVTQSTRAKLLDVHRQLKYIVIRNVYLNGNGCMFNVCDNGGGGGERWVVGLEAFGGITLCKYINAYLGCHRSICFHLFYYLFIYFDCKDGILSLIIS